jgi:hypothetical protein
MAVAVANNLLSVLDGRPAVENMVNRQALMDRSP